MRALKLAFALAGLLVVIRYAVLDLLIYRPELKFQASGAGLL